MFICVRCHWDRDFRFFFNFPRPAAYTENRKNFGLPLRTTFFSVETTRRAVETLKRMWRDTDYATGIFPSPLFIPMYARSLPLSSTVINFAAGAGQFVTVGENAYVFYAKECVRRIFKGGEMWSNRYCHHCSLFPRPNDRASERVTQEDTYIASGHDKKEHLFFSCVPVEALPGSESAVVPQAGVGADKVHALLVVLPMGQ